MNVKSGQAVTTAFTTVHPTAGAATDADATPTGKLVVNGSDNAAEVTVTKVGTGYYKAAFTLPALSAGDCVELRIAATVAGVAGVALVWRAVADTVRLSDVDGHVGIILKWITNKLARTDNGDGTITYVLYDDDNSTPLKTWVYATASGTRAKAT